MSHRDIEYEKEKHRKIEQEKDWMHETAVHEGLDPNDENLAEKLSWGKTWEVAYEEFENKIEKGWIMKKTRKGNVFIKMVWLMTNRQKARMVKNILADVFK